MVRREQRSLWLDSGMVEDEEETSQAEGSGGPLGPAVRQECGWEEGWGEARCESRDSAA